MPYGNERKAPAVNIEDAKKIMEMVWHQEEVMVALSDGSEVCLKNDHGSQEPDISADTPRTPGKARLQAPGNEAALHRPGQRTAQDLRLLRHRPCKLILAPPTTHIQGGPTRPSFPLSILKAYLLNKFKYSSITKRRFLEKPVISLSISNLIKSATSLFAVA